MEECVFEYEKNDGGVTLKKFLSGGEEVVIPEYARDAGGLTGLPITRIAPECFKENGIMITRIVVPETVKVLENDAFAYCVSLQELLLPDTIEVLGADYLIASGLEEAYIPAGVNVIERPELIDRRFIVSPDNKCFSSDGFGLYETKNGTKTLVAVNASDVRDHYCIEANTVRISPGALRDISTLKRMHIPAELDIIEEGSLSFTGGRATGSYGLEDITVASGNKRFLIKYDCLCERAGDGSLKLIRFFGGKCCAPGQDVARIGRGCFKNTRLEQITFLRDDISIGEEAFSGCLLSYAYTPSGSIFFGEEDQFVTEDFVTEFGKNGKLYDYRVYDDFLETEYLTEPRVRMICHRLQNPAGLCSESVSHLRGKMTGQMRDIIELLAQEHNCATLGDLGELGFFTSDNIDEYIQLTVELEEKEMTAWFMSYKNSNIGFSDDLGYL